MTNLQLKGSGRTLFRHDAKSQTDPATYVFTIQGTTGDTMLDVVFTTLPGKVDNPNQPASQKSVKVSQSDLAEPDARFVLFLSRTDAGQALVDVQQDSLPFRISAKFVESEPAFDGISWEGTFLSVFFTLRMN